MQNDTGVTNLSHTKTHGKHWKSFVRERVANGKVLSMDLCFGSQKSQTDEWRFVYYHGALVKPHVSFQGESVNLPTIFSLISNLGNCPVAAQHSLHTCTLYVHTTHWRSMNVVRYMLCYPSLVVLSYVWKCNNLSALSHEGAIPQHKHWPGLGSLLNC